MNAGPRGWFPAGGFLLPAILLAAGCGSTPPAFDDSPVEPAQKVRLAAEREPAEPVTLGDPALTAGLPGEGPLTLAEVDAFLARPESHVPLAARMPWGGDEAAALIAIPDDNPLTRAKIELGRQLFFDRRLANEKEPFGCADCHHPRDTFAHKAHNMDRTIGFGRAAPVVFNRVLSKAQYWDGRAATLEDQVLEPLSNPQEMATTPEDACRRLASIPAYRRQFLVIFGEVSPPALAKALASFLRSLVTLPAPYDTVASLPPHAESGRQLFFGKAQCAECHRGPNFTDEQFHNLGVGLDEASEDLGRFRVTHRDDDRGRFKTPTLRMVEKTQPYMHRGQLRRLEEVIDWYDQGGGANPHLDPRLKPLGLTGPEKANLLAFLRTLTGELPPVETGRLPPR